VTREIKTRFGLCHREDDAVAGLSEVEWHVIKCGDVTVSGMGCWVLLGVKLPVLTCSDRKVHAVER
jgi:hypothetical protein